MGWSKSCFSKNEPCAQYCRISLNGKLIFVCSFPRPRFDPGGFDSESTLRSTPSTPVTESASSWFVDSEECAEPPTATKCCVPRAGGRGTNLDSTTSPCGLTAAYALICLTCTNTTLMRCPPVQSRPSAKKRLVQATEESAVFVADSGLLSTKAS